MKHIIKKREKEPSFNMGETVYRIVCSCGTVIESESVTKTEDGFLEHYVGELYEKVKR